MLLLGRVSTGVGMFPRLLCALITTPGRWFVWTQGLHASPAAVHLLTTPGCRSVQIQPHLDVRFDTMSYRPTVFFNEFWQMRDNLIPVNSTLQVRIQE